MAGLAVFGKVMLGRASGDDMLEAMSAIGMEMETSDLPCDLEAVATVAEELIVRGVEAKGTFRLVTIRGRNGGKISALLFLE